MESPSDLPRFARALVWAAALGFVAHLALQPLAETDLFFHLKIGQLITERHFIPFRNLFSFTYPEHADPDLAWGFQVAVALAYRAGGFSAIVLFKTALVVVAAALAGLSARRSGAGVLAAATVVVAAAITAEPRLVERPHLLTFVGLGLLNVLLAAHERGRPRALWWTAPLVLVWANFHAGVFLAPLVLVLYGVGGFLDGRRDARPFAAAAVAAALTFATPAGARLPSYLLWHTGLGATRDLDEFRRADLWNDPWFFALAGGCALVALLRFRAVGARRLLPVALVGVLAWRSVRFVAEWAFLATPLLAIGVTALGRGLLSAFAVDGLAIDAPGGKPSSSFAGGRRRVWTRLAAALLVVGIVAEVAQARRGQRFALGLAPDVVPFTAIEFVTRNGLRDRLYEDLDVGCYLLWEGWPRWQVFQDARLPAYPDEFHRALDQTPLAPAAFDALLARYGVDAALLSTPDINMRAGSFDPEEWALVFRDDDAVVFARRLPKYVAVIAAHELPLRLRFRFLGGTTSEPLPAPPARSPVPACEWQRRLAAALDESNPDRALDARAAALACLSPLEQAEVYYRLGARLQLAGRPRAAIAEYARSLALRPEDERTRANLAFAHATIEALP